MTPYLIYLEPPSDFHPTVEAAGCYCEFKDKILLLKRHPDRPQGNTWGMPGGKLEKGESAQVAVIREVDEETGLKIAGKGLEKVGEFYMRLPHIDYIFHVFRKRFEAFPDLHLALDEHLEAKWVTLAEALEFQLVAGGREVIQYYQKFLYTAQTK